MAAQKMRKKRENEKEREKLKASRPEIFINEQKGLLIVSCLGLYTAQSQEKYQTKSSKLLQGQNGKRSGKEEQKPFNSAGNLNSAHG